jgi:hypothetical protein
MKIEKLIGLLLCIGLMALSVRADDQERFRARLAGSEVGEHVAGVPSGGAPWKVAHSEVRVNSSGTIEVEAKGLLISSGPFVDTVGPVTMVMASLVCGDVDVADTVSVPLSSSGDFKIKDTIQVPSPCIAPAVLVRVSATTGGPLANGPFIAVNALTSGDEDQDEHEH